MAKTKAEPEAPQVPVFKELESTKVEDLNSCQEQARFNTRCLIKDTRELDELQRELREVEHKLQSLSKDVSSAAKDLILKQKEAIKEKEKIIRGQIQNRRIKAGSLLRRRASLEKEENKKEAVVKEQERNELVKRLKVGDIAERRKRIEIELATLADELGVAQMKARSPSQRDFARRLLALQRACYAGLEAMKRAPELIITEDEEI